MLHPKLNSNKMLVIPPEKTQHLSIDPPVNWLGTLVDKEIWRIHISRHAGGKSHYSLKRSLEESLLVIYQRLANESVSADTKSFIREKLCEGVDSCTEGFHIRVGEILAGFNQPDTMEDILYNIRFDIINKEAQKHAQGETHTYNRFFIIAYDLGFCVRPLNNMDISRGNVEDSKIKLYLWKAFKDGYHPNAIILAFQEQLRSIFAYAGAPDCGEQYDTYTRSSYKFWGKFLKKILLCEDVFDCLKSDEKTQEIIGLNWNNIKKKAWDFFIRQRYFNFDQEEQRFFTRWYFADNPQTTLTPAECKLLDEKYAAAGKDIYADPLLFLLYVQEHKKSRQGERFWQNANKKEAKAALVRSLIAGDENLFARIERLKKNKKIDLTLQNALQSAWQQSLAARKIYVLNQLLAPCLNMEVAFRKISGGNLNSLLISAVQNNLSALVSQLLNLGANTNRAIAASSPVLIIAAEKGFLHIVKILLEKGANIEAVNQFGCTALILAVWNQQITVVDYLLQKGANVNAQEQNGNCPLICAAKIGNIKMVNQLLHHKANINLRDSNQCTALYWAAERGYTELVDVLLKEEADVNVVNTMNSTPLTAAALRGHFTTVQILLTQGLVGKKLINPRDSYVLLLAAERREFAIVDLLIEKGADVNVWEPGGMTALILMAQTGHLELVKRLLAKGAKINEHIDGYTALIAAAQNNRPELVKFLLGAGANPDIRSDLFGNALSIAVEQGFFATACLLLQRGANANLRSCSGMPPLIEAVKKGNFDLVKLLLSYGANVNVVNPDGTTPLTLAVKKNHFSIVKILLKKGAQIDAASSDFHIILALAKRSGFLPIARLLENTEQLLNAAKEGNIITTEHCLKAGGIKQATDKSGLTPLQLALRNNHITVAMKLRKAGVNKIEVLQSLAYMKPKSIHLLLQQAKEKRDHELCKALLLHKISLRIEDYQQRRFIRTSPQRIDLLAQIPELLAQVGIKPIDNVIHNLLILGKKAQEDHFYNSGSWFFRYRACGFNLMIQDIILLVRQLHEHAQDETYLPNVLYPL